MAMDTGVILVPGRDMQKWASNEGRLGVYSKYTSAVERCRSYDDGNCMLAGDESAAAM